MLVHPFFPSLFAVCLFFCVCQSATFTVSPSLQKFMTDPVGGQHTRHPQKPWSSAGRNLQCSFWLSLSIPDMTKGSRLRVDVRSARSCTAQFWAARGVNADCHRLNLETSWLMRTSCNSIGRTHSIGSLYQPSSSQPSALRSLMQLVLAGSCSGNRFDFWQKPFGHRPSLRTLNKSMQRLVCCSKAALLASHSLFGCACYPQLSLECSLSFVVERVGKKPLWRPT